MMSSEVSADGASTWREKGMMAQAEQKMTASCDDAVVVRSPWRSLVLSFDAKCSAIEPD